MESFEKMYSVKEVSAISGWSVDSIRRRIDSGHIRAKVLPRISGKRKRVYKSRRIPESEVRRFLKPE